VVDDGILDLEGGRREAGGAGRNGKLLRCEEEDSQAWVGTELPGAVGRSG
jgi:hypothetical protein